MRRFASPPWSVRPAPSSRRGASRCASAPSGCSSSIRSHSPPEAAEDDDSDPEAAAAVALFIAVARARDPDLTLAPGDGPAVVEVCRRLDGLPLAIELAAGNLGLLSVSQLAARLRQRIDTLGAPSRDVPDRQRTLAATLQWSYGLLTAQEQRTLEALAVFAGGCTGAAAQFVTESPLETLQAIDEALREARPAMVG